MAKFAINQQVRVPTNNPTAESRHKGKVGVVTSIGSRPPGDTGGGRPAFLFEQQYFVRFDDDAIAVQVMFEGQLEAA